MVEIMKQKEWNFFEEQLKTKNRASKALCNETGIDYDDISAIFEQLNTRKTIRSFRLVKRKGPTFLNDFLSGTSLIDIADHGNLSPVLVAREVLERHESVKKKKVSHLLKNLSLIKDERLRNEVSMCLDADAYAGPHADRTRNVVGLQYEQLLFDKVKNLRLEYFTEDQLRQTGSYKTPDVLLQVPITVVGRIVNWIDSKAKAADAIVMDQDYEDSIRAYVNRFGPGMVIYWNGFVEDYQTNMFQDAGVLVCDHFPKDIKYLKGSFIPLRSEAVEIVSEDEYNLTKGQKAHTKNMSLTE